MRIGKSLAISEVHIHLPNDIAEAVIRSWNENWRGSEIYITNKKKPLAAMQKWHETTLAAIKSAGGNKKHLAKIKHIFSGHFVRF